VRNYKRLLKAFSLELKEEIHDSTDLELANLIHAKAGLIASSIRRTFEPSYANPECYYPGVDAGGLDSSSDEEHVVENDDEFAALVSRGRSFIEGSDALKKLREDFHYFVMPLREDSPQSIMATGTEAPSEDLHRLTLLLPPGLTSKVYRNVLAILSKLGLREDDIPPGYQRFRWTNVSI
jgi:hypothetical protein